MTNLLANTSYEWQVQSSCQESGKKVTGAFSPLQTFTTNSLKVGDESGGIEVTSMNLYPNPASHDFILKMQLAGVDEQNCSITINKYGRSAHIR
jgi:hypothetical protein